MMGDAGTNWCSVHYLRIPKNNLHTVAHELIVQVYLMVRPVECKDAVLFIHIPRVSHLAVGDERGRTKE